MAIEEKKENPILKFLGYFWRPIPWMIETTVKDSQGLEFKVSKGAPQVIFQMCNLDADTDTRAKKAVEDFAAKGYPHPRCGPYG